MSAGAERLSLRETLKRSSRLAERRIWGAAAGVDLVEVAAGTSLDCDASAMDGRAVLLRVADPLFAALALIELDGLARRIVLCPPDLADDALPGVIATAGIDALVSDGLPPAAAAQMVFGRLALPVRPLADDAGQRCTTPSG